MSKVNLKMFKVVNPVPRVIHPDWLHKKVREKDDKYRQKKLVDIFGSLSKNNCLKGSSDVISNKHGVDEQNAADLEDFGKISRTFRVGPRPVVHCFDANEVQQLSKTLNWIVPHNKVFVMEALQNYGHLHKKLLFLRKVLTGR